MILFQLFLIFFQIGALSFGGGYAAMPLIQAQVIENYHWLTQKDFSDLISLSEMTPGPIAVNSATFVGNMVAGIPGSFFATLGVILPSCIFVTLLSIIYTKYRNLALMKGILKFLRPAVVAMIFTAGLKVLIPALFDSGYVSLDIENCNIRLAIYFIVSLILLKKFKTGPIKIMFACGIMEVIINSILIYA